MPADFDDSDADSQVHPMARLMFSGNTAAEVFLVDVSWSHMHDEPEPYYLTIYFTFERDDA